MNGLPPVDPALVMKQATQNELVQRKLDMDALRKRLGDTATKEEKLRESCEGFEAIFLQKMWEQMRKNVPKEGYLHSKDEEMYQSLFDIELCKKMAGAGGVGLADMLYTQLSQQLENTGRTTTPSTYRKPLEIAPAQGLLPVKAAAAEARPAFPKEADTALKAADLYTPLPQDEVGGQEKPGDARTSALADALQEFKADLGLAPKEAPGTAAREWAEAREAAVRGVPLQPAAAPAAAGSKPSETAQVKQPVSNPALASWQGPGPVSATPKPTHLFGRGSRANKTKTEQAETKTPAPPRGMAPQDTVWPLEGPVVSRFGWEDDPAGGKRRWNAGIKIAAAPESPVKAVLSGTVVYAGQRDGIGHTVVVEHKDGFRSYYGNLEPSGVKVGDVLQRGAEFAKITAQPFPPANGENSASLHFEFKKGEMALNPESAINRMTTAAR